LGEESPRVFGVLAGDAVPGDENYKARILERMRQTGLGTRFRWLGNLEPIEPFMQGIDLFVNTSEYETFGMSVCESMACGHPVAGYASGSVREVVGDTGPVVETGDLDGLTAAARELLQTPDRLRERGDAARRRVVERFDSDVSFKLSLSLYRDVLARTGGRG
jgi:glycosyltransferase involved in cell wall biosynthesis